jgi:glutamate synthase (ferredoxin)
LDLGALLFRPAVPESFAVRNIEAQDHALQDTFDQRLIRDAAPALLQGSAVQLAYRIENTQRSIGTRLSYEISRRHGADGLDDGSVQVQFTGSAGQSFAAFAARGLRFAVHGDGNDYFGKGLSGAVLSLQPDPSARFAAEDNIILGNVALYGATSGAAYIRGIAGERFAVRNSGATAVVEGVGDHGCEYMTGGTVAVLGPTGRNFAAGMSGGIAYVFDAEGDFAVSRCNTESVELGPVAGDDAGILHGLLEQHVRHTGSALAQRLLADWPAVLPRFIKVLPTDYRLALQRLAREQANVGNPALELVLEQ